MDFYKRTVKFLARSSHLVHMARGRRGRPASVRSRVSRVNADIEDPVARPSRTREHRSSGRRSSRSHVAASSGSGRSSSPSRRNARERSHRRSRSASRSPEPPTWAKEILKALEAKTEEVKVVKEQLDSLKRKSAEEEPEFKYKSNKKQFKFNTDVKDKFNQILERAGADDAITKIANEGMSLLDNRNKLISIADRDGWDVVEYFEADPLTKNDEEEKKLRVARKEAERSREKRNRKNSLRSKMGTRFKSQSTSSKSGPSVNFGPSHRIVDFRPDVGQLLVNPVPEKKASVYRCFGCGKAGHFIKDCKVSSSAK